MEKDIAPELLEFLEECFDKKIEQNIKIPPLLQAIYDGKASYIEAEDYAFEVGSSLAEVFRENLSSKLLPDGKMYYNIADRVIRPLLETEYMLAANVATQVQNTLNQKAGIGLKAQMIEVDEDRVQGIIDKVSNADAYDEMAWVLGDPVINLCQSAVDAVLKANVEFQGSAGLRPRIIRRAERKCCKWCSNLAGEYNYPNLPHDVYRRHENCRCTVDYDPGVGKRMQNVHTKKWVDKDVREQRIKLSEQNNLFERKRKMELGEDEEHDGFRNVTGKWYREADFSTKEVIKATEYTADGITYKVDGKHVLMDYKKNEEKIAKLLVEEFGGTIQIVPRVVFPQKVSTPDYIYKGGKYDLKSPTGRGKDVLYDMVSKKKSQATNYVFDVTDCPLSEEEIMDRVNSLYRSHHTRFVETVLLVKDGKIQGVYERK